MNWARYFLIGPLAGMVAGAAGVEGLVQRATIQITAQMFDSPFLGDLPPEVWALRFSPDERYLAVGAGFVKKKSSRAPLEDYKSYIAIVEADRPGAILKKFEIPRHPAMRVYTPLHWSPDGRFLVTPLFGTWEQAAIIDLATDRVHVIPNERCRVEGVLAGPQVVQYCSGYTLRLVGVDGEVVKQWSSRDSGLLLDVDSLTGQVAMLLHDRSAETAAISIIDADDGTERKRWDLPPMQPYGESYFGAFAWSGDTLCARRYRGVTAGQELLCWATISGKEELRRTLPSGSGGPVLGAGKYVVIGENEVRLVPKFLQRLLDTSFFYAGKGTHTVWAIDSGAVVARWPARSQRVLPGVDSGWAYAVSASGRLIAHGGAGQVMLYSLEPAAK